MVQSETKGKSTMSQVDQLESQGNIRLYPLKTNFALATHKGWGIDSKCLAQEVFAEVSKSQTDSQFQLEYTWESEEPILEIPKATVTTLLQKPKHILTETRLVYEGSTDNFGEAFWKKDQDSPPSSVNIKRTRSNSSSPEEIQSKIRKIE